MPSLTFIALTLFIFLAIVGGIIGIVLEGRRIDGSGAHDPATHDTVFPIVGWAILFAFNLAIEYVGAQNLTPGFKSQLGTLAILPFFYGLLATGWLIWRSAAASMRACATANRSPGARSRCCMRCAFRSCLFARSCRWRWATGSPDSRRVFSCSPRAAGADQKARSRRPLA
jgi:hypothetical protein